MNFSKARQCALMVVGCSLAACSADAISDGSSADAVESGPTACDAKLSDGTALDLACRHRTPAGSAEACIYGQTKRYVTMTGTGADTNVSGIARLNDGSSDASLQIGPGLGQPVEYILGRSAVLRADRSSYDFEEAKYSLKKIKDLDRSWDSADVLTGVAVESLYVSFAEADNVVARTPAQIAEYKKARDAILAKCVARGADEGTCKASTILMALWSAKKLSSEADLRAVADVDKAVTFSVPFICTK